MFLYRNFYRIAVNACIYLSWLAASTTEIKCNQAAIGTVRQIATDISIKVNLDVL
jgi:hypothetical protein